MNPPDIHQLIKCPCLHCGGSIEFDADAAGQEFDCPHCGKKTWVDVPGKMNYLPPKAKHPAPPIENAFAKTPSIRKKSSTIFARIVTAFLFLTSLVFIFQGCAGESEEQSKANSSAIRGTIYAIQYCSGFILFGITLLMDILIRILEKE